jgi:hypothetical protein
VPRPPVPTAAVGFGSKCGERVIVAGKHAAEVTGFTGAPFAQLAPDAAESDLFVHVGAGFEAIARGVDAFGQIAAVAASSAGNLFRETAHGVLDGNDVGRAEDSEHERTAVGVV